MFQWAGLLLGVILFSLALNPFVHRVSRHINGTQTNAGQTHMVVAAYAGDMTTLFMDPSEIDTAVEYYHTTCRPLANV